MLNCTCPISTLVRHINLGHLNDISVVDVNQFKDTLSVPENMVKVNDCLSRHGFTGTIEVDCNGDYHYWSNI